MDTKWGAGRPVSFLAKIWATERCQWYGIWPGNVEQWMDMRDLKGKIGNTWCQSECRGGGEGEEVSRMVLKFQDW